MLPVPTAYRVQFRVFVLGIDVFDVLYNIVIQCFSQKFVLAAEQLEAQLQQGCRRHQAFIPQQD